MRKRVFHFYYDIISVHSWVMFERLLLAGNGISDVVVKFKPVHSANIITAAGNKIPYYTPALKKFFFHDVRFLGRLHNISIKTPKNEIDDLLLATTSSVAPQYLLTLIAEHYPEKLVDASQLLWTMLWVDNRTVHTDDDIAAIIEMLALPPSTFDDLSEEKWAKLLNERQSEALASGCFGVPWLVIEDGKNSHKYFGCDRWPLIQRRFKTGFQKCIENFHSFPHRPVHSAPGH